MRISNLKIKGFRSFGSAGVNITLNEDLAAFIGLNSAGKTTALEALRKIFGHSIAEREINRQDFHIGKNENPDQISERELSIEVKIIFSEDEQEAVPHFFSNLVVDGLGEELYLRIRLEATWKKSEILPQGEIDVKTYFICVPEVEIEDSASKRSFPNHFRSLIEVLYVPAIRRPAEQLRYVSGSILYRVLRKIKWQEEFKEDFDEKINEINKSFQSLKEFTTVQNSITEFWKRFHKDERYKDTLLGFSGSDVDSILKKLEISFSPTGTHKTFGIDELGDGYRSLFYLTLVCSLLDVEEKLAKNDEQTIGITRPLLTILAIEEPENHIAPQLLGRVVQILKVIGEKQSSQVLLSSHTPSIVKRLNPESISHFRIAENYETEVNNILLPKETNEAYKYIKEAIHNYPEIYFAKLVVIGEGDSEEVIFNRLMDIMNIDFDDNIITFAPLGHRFVSHIWKLLNALHIPYITLLDLDVEREGGGWGRIKYILKELIEIGVEKDKLLKLRDGNILPDERFNNMHSWELNTVKNLKYLNTWVDFLTNYNVFYSRPLDLDFLMLTHFQEFYKKAIPENGGPRIPDKTIEPDKFNEKVKTAIQATLKSEQATAVTYSNEDKELMIWYNYHFLGRGKPATHIQVLSSMTDSELKDNLPEVFQEIFEKITLLLNAE